jgi:hypothetical protein
MLGPLEGLVLVAAGRVACSWDIPGRQCSSN